MSVEESILKLFVERGWTLAVAESCTGGALSARLTAIAGASAYFLGGVVCYSNEWKVKLLRVPPELIELYGAVSQEVVIAMAEGALGLSGADFSLAVTGIAGPAGGTVEKPVGTVWCAIGRKGGLAQAWRLQAEGSRQSIIQQTTQTILEQFLCFY